MNEVAKIKGQGWRLRKIYKREIDILSSVGTKIDSVELTNAL